MLLIIMVNHAFNLSFLKLRQKNKHKLIVQPWLHREFQISLGLNMGPISKMKKQNKTKIPETMILFSYLCNFTCNSIYVELNFYFKI